MADLTTFRKVSDVAQAVRNPRANKMGRLNMRAYVRGLNENEIRRQASPELPRWHFHVFARGGEEI